MARDQIQAQTRMCLVTQIGTERSRNWCVIAAGLSQVHIRHLPQLEWNDIGKVAVMYPRGIKKATGRVSAANLSRMAKQFGRCGDINPITGYVCVIQIHDDSVKHAAVQIGGPADGKVFSEW